MTAFFGEPALKEAVLTRLDEHRRLDQFVQKIYFSGGKGCHLGCLTHSNDEAHVATERLFGIPVRVSYWLEAVFEGLPKNRCAWWAIESIRAIPVGADLSLAHHHFAAWLLGESGLLTIVDCNRAAIEQCRVLHERAGAGEIATEREWSAAASAARSAAWSAAESAAGSAAGSAAWSAAESAARSAAWSAAESAAAAAAARSAAWSAAAWSAWSAAESAAWDKIAAKSIEIFAASPVIGRTGECEPCVKATFAHLERRELVRV